MCQELSVKDISFFRENGYLAPVPGLTNQQTSEFRRAVQYHLRGEPICERYELTEEVKIRKTPDVVGPTTYEYIPGDELDNRENVFPFLFNIWKSDPRFLELGVKGRFGKIAKQLLGANKVLFFEDNVVVKQPHSNYLPWHQVFLTGRSVSQVW